MDASHLYYAARKRSAYYRDDAICEPSELPVLCVLCKIFSCFGKCHGIFWVGALAYPDQPREMRFEIRAGRNNPLASPFRTSVDIEHRNVDLVKSSVQLGQTPSDYLDVETLSRILLNTEKGRHEDI